MWMCLIHAWQSRKKKGTPAASLLHPPPPSPLVGRHFTVGHPVFQAGRIVRAPASPGGRAARRQLLDRPHSLGFFPGGHGGLSISAYRRCSRPAGFPPAGWRLSPEGDGQRFPPRYRTHRMVMSSEAALPSTWTDTSSSICRSTEAGSRDGEEARARIIASLE